MVIDIDGTITPILQEHEYATRSSFEDWRSWLRTDDAVVEQLDMIARHAEVRRGMVHDLATGSRAMVDRRPLQGMLGSQYVAWRGWPRRGWRMRSLASFAVEPLNAAIVWGDDRVPADAQRRTRDITGIPALVVRPKTSSRVCPWTTRTATSTLWRGGSPFEHSRGISSGRCRAWHSRGPRIASRPTSRLCRYGREPRILRRFSYSPIPPP